MIQPGQSGTALEFSTKPAKKDAHVCLFWSTPVWAGKATPWLVKGQPKDMGGPLSVWLHMNFWATKESSLWLKDSLAAILNGWNMLECPQIETGGFQEKPIR